MTAAVASTSRVHMDVAPGQRIRFGETGVEIEVVHKTGRSARLLITTPRDVDIERTGDARPVPSMQPSA